MRLKIWICIGLFTSALIGLYCSSPCLSYTPSKKQLLADEVRTSAAKKITSKQPLSLIGEGGQMLDEIVMLSLSFQDFRECNLESARELIVCATKTLVDEVNNNKAIHPYLKNYPFTANNVEIRIWFYKPDYTDVGNKSIKFTLTEDGKIEYYFGGSEYNINKPSFTETYDEAVKLLSTRKSEFSKN